MADTAIAITAGAGTNVDTRTEGTNGNHRQVIVIGDPATNAGVAPVDATKGLAVDLTASGALPTVTNLSQLGGQAVAMGTGVRSAGTQRVTVATDDLVPVNNSQIGGNAISTGSGVMGTGTQRVALATDSPGIIPTGSQASPSSSYLSTIAAGDIAHDGVDSGNPVKVGGVARSSEPTAVATADRVQAMFDLVGKMIVLPYANPENFVSGAITTSMTGTTSTSLIAAPGAGLRNYITQITVSNAHATVGTDIAIQDGSGGTTLYTIPAAAVYGGAVITFPTPLRQPTANTALFCANVTTGASTKVSASGYKGA